MNVVNTMIYPLIEQLAKKSPSKTALHFDDRSYSYRRFLSHLDATGREIREMIPADSAICLLSPNLPDALFLLLGISNTNNRVLALDKFVSASEVRDIIGQYSLKHIIFHKSFLSLILDLFRDISEPSKLNSTEEDFYILDSSHPQQKISGKSKIQRWFSSEKKTVIEENDAYILFASSGSSGLPKVFELSQSQFYHQIINVRDNFKFMESDSALCTLHFSHNHSVCLMFSILAAGGTIHLMPVAKALAPNIIDYISRHKISVFSNVPMIYKAFADLSKHLDTKGLSSLRMAICGSAPLSSQVAELFYEKFGQHLHQSYGLSEIGPVCVNLFKDGNYDYSSVGTIFPEIDYMVVDEDGISVDPGEEGHLLLKGKSMTNGYLNNPEANEEMFPNEWMHTQDIVRIDADSNMTVIGRRSNFINVGGLKVFPAEIERTIMNMEEVKEVAVISANDDLFGQVVKAFIVKHDGATLDEAQVKTFCSQHLSNFKVPKTVLFIKELPKNAIGKIVGSKLPG